MIGLALHGGRLSLVDTAAITTLELLCYTKTAQLHHPTRRRSRLPLKRSKHSKIRELKAFKRRLFQVLAL